MCLCVLLSASSIRHDFLGKALPKALFNLEYVVRGVLRCAEVCDTEGDFIAEGRERSL